SCSLSGKATLRRRSLPVAHEPPPKRSFDPGQPPRQPRTETRSQGAREEGIRWNKPLAAPPGPVRELLDKVRVVLRQIPLLSESLERGAVPGGAPPPKKVRQIRQREGRRR